MYSTIDFGTSIGVDQYTSATAPFRTPIPRGKSLTLSLHNYEGSAPLIRLAALPSSTGSIPIVIAAGTTQ
jgi:hypothetical protein